MAFTQWIGLCFYIFGTQLSMFDVLGATCSYLHLTRWAQTLVTHMYGSAGENVLKIGLLVLRYIKFTTVIIQNTLIQI